MPPLIPVVKPNNSTPTVLLDATGTGNAAQLLESNYLSDVI